MKTAISLPDDVFRQADAAAERLGWSRSQLYSRAVQEFLDREREDPVTSALDELADEIPQRAAEGGTAEQAPNVGRSIIRSGAWTW